MKTRRALEDTFDHLSASNKNKKNVEKAITKQLLITKSILKKTRNYEEAQYENWIFKNEMVVTYVDKKVRSWKRVTRCKQLPLGIITYCIYSII